ncbi:unnamed protein product [Rotaria sp. Silwood1]|nr:unnamed protein product [Rotaria sp. Silwood1]
MCANQSPSLSLSFVVHSMDELFEYIDGNIFDPFNFNSRINNCDEAQKGDSLKMDTDLITVEHSSNDSYKTSDDLHGGGEIYYKMNSLEYASSLNTSDGSESSSIGKIPSPLNENNDDAEFFNAGDWIIDGTSSSKIRPPKLCEYLRLLLDNPRYASYASWINKDEGLFKIHNPPKVASLWKRVKIRQTHGLMNYETFARCMRYYYKSGLMIKTHRRHTYRFAQT